MTTKRPNILFLMSDQHRPDFTGYEGHPVRTPCLDWLAETGAQFRNCYAPNPVCVPCRHSLAAGQLPRTCGQESFHGDLQPSSLTFAKRFSQYAYNTVCCGKLHHSGWDQMQGWRKRIGEELNVHTGFVEDRVPEEFARYQQEEGASDAPNFYNSLKRSGVGENPVQFVDEYTVDGALMWMKLQYQNGLRPHNPETDAPVMLKVSLIAPHDPFITDDPEAYAYHLNKAKPFTDENPLPEMATEKDWPGIWRPGKDLGKNDIRNAHAAYAAMIERIDDQYQQVLDGLEAVGQDLDDWIIVYCSDHGELMGEHNCWWKFKFYDGCVRVPLIIRAPKYFAGGKLITENVNLCDLYATLCDMADIPTPEGLDSRSLVPLAKGEAPNWNDESISQVGGNLMIKQGTLKYIWFCDTDEGEKRKEVLFDLSLNPEENVNYIDDEKYTEAIEQFRVRCAALGHGPNADPNYVNAGY